jgi:aspartyl-tRNA(Asn)/glutamyl-tRNA(Gln) amidotransferase subunit C
MSMISKDEIRHLGWLSRLELTDEELTKYEFQIREIIGYLDKLDTISLEEVETVRLRREVSGLRQDCVEPFEGDPLESAKNRKDGFIMGPRII